MKFRVGSTVFESDRMVARFDGYLCIEGIADKVSPADVMFRQGKDTSVTVPFNEPGAVTDTLPTITARSEPTTDGRQRVKFEFAKAQWICGKIDELNGKRSIEKAASIDKPVLSAHKRKFFTD